MYIRYIPMLSVLAGPTNFTSSEKLAVSFCISLSFIIREIVSIVLPMPIYMNNINTFSKKKIQIIVLTSSARIPPSKECGGGGTAKEIHPLNLKQNYYSI